MKSDRIAACTCARDAALRLKFAILAVAYLCTLCTVSAWTSSPSLLRPYQGASYALREPCATSDFSHSTTHLSLTRATQSSRLVLHATTSEQEARKGIDKVVAALRKDKTANEELGRLEKVNNILGYGVPKPNELAVRFNASFRKGGMGRSAVPLPFGLGQSKVTEGRGTMVGQVKASVDLSTGKVLQCSVFRDLGYGRSFNLKV
jgi:hypothetical protein